MSNSLVNLESRGSPKQRLQPPRSVPVSAPVGRGTVLQQTAQLGSTTDHEFLLLYPLAKPLASGRPAAHGFAGVCLELPGLSGGGTIWPNMAEHVLALNPTVGSPGLRISVVTFGAPCGPAQEIVPQLQANFFL